MEDQPRDLWRLASSVVDMLKDGPLKVSVIGSGNWGTVMAKVIGDNVNTNYMFSKEVRMWVFEEVVNGRNLTEIINNDHENVKYMPGLKLSPNVVAVANVVDCARDADLLVFVLPHQFLKGTCAQLAKANVVKKHTLGISLIKGLAVSAGYPVIMSEVIKESLGIDCCALAGANVANGVAAEEFCETTIGYSNRDYAAIWKQLFETSYFRVNLVPDSAGVEVCGAVKNVLALAAGFCDGLKLGTNTKAAIIRLGIEEMRDFALVFYHGITEETFFDSAGVADVITTCFGGRNVKCAAQFVSMGGKTSWEQIEADMLNGQKLQGTLTCKDVYEIISFHNLQNMFPLFCATYRVAFEGKNACHIIEAFQNDETRVCRRDANEYTACSIPWRLQVVRDKVRRKTENSNL